MPLALALLLGLGASPSAALANSPGGTRGPSAAAAGGSEFGVPAHARSAPARPVITRLTVPTTAAPGPPPVVTLQIDEAGSGTVDTRVAILSLTTHRPVVAVALGWVPTGRILVVRWPSHARLAPGSYHVSVKAQDAHGVSLLRRAHASGVATLDVRAPAPVTAPAPAPTPTPTPTPTPAGAPTPAETVADGAVFPVAGTHSFGGPENRFGAPRAGHVHQGQDVLTAEGTPVLAPLAGVITSTAVQAGGAGYYLVEHTGYGLDFMFAHCQAGSFAVAQGQSVSAGTVLCHAGQTGDATTPHLHIEIWVGRWQEAGGYPIDPLPYLQAWESA
ncbi:MAG TPA: M23 family metallopeptidase [Solirubrobacteraceae bacterium]|jgi:biotin carboxyl carrier protein|nr:M23 family metallopeptidase [Solirubrobacteraceae bacterium]